MKFFKVIALMLLAVGTSGCYAGKAKKIYDSLKIGTTKSELDKIFHDLKFIREQTVLAYPNHSENSTRGSIWTDNSYVDIQPEKEIINKFTFDGNTKVYSYLISTESNWPNNDIIHYVAIFYDRTLDKIIGKAIIRTTIAIHNWDEKF